MIKAIMNGCNGRMGQVITAICKEDPEIEIVAGVDLYDGIKNDYPVFPNISVCDVKADVIIDFSNAKAVDDLLIYSADKQISVVLCTTGLSEEQLKRAGEVAGKTAVLKSANMSLGINMLMELLKQAAVILAPAGFDMEIVEKHHNQKLDAPSGTALALADSMNEALSGAYTYKYDRSQERKRRDLREIGISAVRGGNIVGEHEVIFAGLDEVITFEHTAYSRSVFGKGAVQAAKFLAGKPAGFYDMSDVIKATMAGE
ncbi:MAG: 4-hydroxy-tetrahydrodipicolinate reductase [Roseburia sp.]